MAPHKKPEGALTPAQRSKRYRERKGDDRRQRNILRNRESRERLRERQQLLKRSQAKDAMQKRARRQASCKSNSAVQLDPGNSGYACRQTFSKAVKKAMSSLPSCKVRQQAVVRELAKQCGLQVLKPKLQFVSDKGQANSETRDAVTEFYNSNDISWQSPTAKARVIIRRTDANGKVSKTYVQKRYMMMSLKEAYHMSTATNPSLQICISKFCDLRPAEVDTFSHIPPTVCVCKTHENVRLKLVALQTHLGTPVDFRSFIALVVCNQEQEDCMLRKCPTCEGKISELNPQNFAEEPDEIPVKCLQWGKEGSKYVLRPDMNWTLQGCFDELERDLGEFLRHVWIKRCQAKFFQESREKVDGKSIVLEMDFAENFSLKQQDEIQSAHWATSQCTIFTAHAWISKVKERGYCLVSDCLNHDKVSVFKYLDILIMELKQKNDITVVSIFTDGASSQFKQRYILSVIHVLEEKHGIKITWHFFATSHGKGIVDGHGATIKGAVWRRIRSRKVVVKTSSDFYRVGKEACPSLNVKFVPVEDIKTNEETLQNLWGDVKHIPDLHKVHSIRSVGPFKLQYSATSSTLESGRVVKMK